MSDIGKIGWIDLTVPNAGEVKDFYTQVTGWTASAATVADYEDYCVHPSADADPVAGICHKKGANADVPSQWLIYINVADLKTSIEKCIELGGEIVSPAREMGGYGTMCVIKDPAGAVAALFQPASQS